MDWGSLSERIGIYFKKYRIVILVLAAGLLLMCLPERNQKETVTVEPAAEESPEAALEHVLSLIEGAGKVAVLLTEKEGREVLYQMDEDVLGGDIRRKTVMTSDGTRQETGLVRQVNPPEFLGAVVICQGADRPKVKLAVVEAVMRATGLPSNCISVLKMK